MKKIKKFESFNNNNEISEGCDPKTSFIDINLDSTKLETSDDKNKKLEQKPGKIIIETPSKTDAYNAKMRLGGEITIDPKFPEKQIHHVKKFNEFYNEFTSTKNSDQYPDYDKPKSKIKYDDERVLSILIDDINKLLIKLNFNIINKLKIGKILLSKLEKKYENDIIISDEISDLLNRIYEYENMKL
jgi:hypothetical protein